MKNSNLKIEKYINKMKNLNSIIEEYINKSTWEVKENANFGFSLSGLKSHLANHALKEEQLANSPSAEYHKSGAIHIHDLAGGSFSPYCYGSDLMSLLMNGIANPSGGSSEAATHFDVVVDHIVNYIYISQNEWEGAQAFSNFDTLLAPFVRYDNLKQKDVKQSIQRMVYNLSYPLRAAFQSPFSNLSFDLKCPHHMRNEPVVIGGEPMTETYSDFQKEMDMINLAFIDVMMEGDRDGRPHTFPIPTYSITRDFDWDCEVTNRLFALTAKFGLPYFMNYIGTGLDPSSQRAMCCRLQMDLNEIIDMTKGGWWNTGVSTGSLGVVSINMAQFGYLMHEHYENNDDIAFYGRLDELIDAAKQHLVYKRMMVEHGFEIGLMPFTKEYLHNFSHFFSTIGIVGMNEGCLNLIGKPIYECTMLVENILNYISDKCRQFTSETGYPWNFEETPAEGACYSLALKDKELYPDIITQGENDGIYYTNSSHIAVVDGLGIGDELRIQDRFKKHYSGGTLQHLRCSDANPDPGAVKDLIRNICSNTSIPYLAFSKSYSICPNCGISDDLTGICPKCNSISDVYARVTGFYQPVKKYNKGKAQEFTERKRWNMNELSNR